MHDERASAGRPRDARIDAAVLAATRRLLAEVGYLRLTYELVAREAGVTRAAIYRRWPSRMHLVHAALFREPEDGIILDTGDFVADLRRLVANTAASYARPEVRAALPGLVMDLHGDEGMRHAVIDTLERRVRDEFGARVAAGVARGELRPDTDADLLLDVVIGAVSYRIVSRDMPAGDLVEQVTAMASRGVILS